MIHCHEILSGDIGCMIVELNDYRPKNPKDSPLDVPKQSRTVLHPTAETLWSDLCMLNESTGRKMSDIDALQVEAEILVSRVRTTATSLLSALASSPHHNHYVLIQIHISPELSMLSNEQRSTLALEPSNAKLTLSKKQKAKRRKLEGKRSCNSSTPDPIGRTFQSTPPA